MDNEQLGGCLTAVVMAIVLILVWAFFVSILIYLLWPVVIPQYFLA